MKEFNPTVSIVIPVYNGSNFVREAIDSALAQTYKNVEVVVVNDGSRDDGATDRIAKSYGDRISYYAKENGGVATALNFGIEKMKGEYFSWLSHDDMYEDSKIEEQVKVLKSLENKNTIIACNTKVLFPNGVKKKEYIDKATFDFVDIFLATSAVVGVNGCALLIPRKALLESGGFDPGLPVTQDYDLWFRLQKKNEFVLLEKNLVISRRHDGQDSVQKQKMCFDAGEELHHNFLSSIAYDRFEKFFKTSHTNIASYWENYIAYKTNGYKKTSSMMLKHLLRYYSENDSGKFAETFSSEIGSISGPTNVAKSKKRLLFYSNVWHRGGIERVLSILLNKISDKYDCLLVINNDDEDTNVGYELPKSVSLVKINNKNQQVELLNLVAILDVDLFIGNPNISEKFLDMYPLLKEVNVKTIAYNHGHYFLPFMCGEYLYPVALKTKQAFGAADYVIWLTEIACNLYNIENGNGVYIPNPGVTTPKSLAKKTANKNILAVARFDDAIKQVDKTLLLFKELHQIDSEYHLDVVGDCSMDMLLPNWGDITLSEFIIEQEIPVDSITFRGEQKNTAKYYENASFLIMTSKSEGFGMVYLEALAKGLPCAGLEYLGIQEIIQDGVNGLVRSQDDLVGLAEAIDATLGSTKLFSEMSQAAISSVEKFNVGNFFAKWEALLALALGEDVSTKQSELLKVTNELGINDYRHITLEYEKLLKDIATEYINKEVQPIAEVSGPVSRIEAINIRFKESIVRDGVFLTGEKIVRKIHKKVTRK